MSPLPAHDPFKTGWRCVCPKCAEGSLYKSRFSLMLHDECPVCGLDLTANDSADGPAVFLIFVLGFLLVPMALILDSIVELPVWVHALIWTPLTLGLTIGSLRPLKAYIIALQYKHLPWDKKDAESHDEKN